MDKEKWTEELLSSLDEIKIVQPRVELYDQILEQINEPKQLSIPLYWLSGIAASFLLLLALNVSFLQQALTEDNNDTDKVLATQFDNIISNQLYEE